jgi:IS30 family transposase
MKHITQEQRYTISVLLKKGKSRSEIADIIGKHRSSVAREIKRNADRRNQEYRAGLAQRKCLERHLEKPKRIQFTDTVKSYVGEKLQARFSPEQIVGRAALDGLDMVSHERIYQYIWEDKKKGGVLHEHLRNKGKRYRKRGALKDRRGIIPNRRHISERPAIVEEKSRIGDLEIDTVMGKNHKGALVTINDRKTNMVKIRKVKGKTAEDVKLATIEALADWVFAKTITADNGKEFASHEKIAEALKIGFFFATPYHSWERGANEKTNGLIRQYVPKQTDFENVTEEYVRFIENELNNRPRKKHGFFNAK